VAEALQAAGDLIVVAGLLLAIGLLYLAKDLAAALRAIFGFGINLGFTTLYPLKWVGDQLAGLIEQAASAGIKASEHVLAGLLSGLTSSLEELIAIPVLLGIAIKDALAYLWHVALHAYVAAVVNPVRSLALRAEALAHAAEATAARDLGIAERYAAAEAARALGEAKAYTAHAVAGAVTEVEAYARQGVEKLRVAEEHAIASARAIAVGAEDALHVIEHNLTAAELAALIASIPALNTLLHAIATEAGLDQPGCRAKVKQTCGTGDLQWAQLLLGLAAMGLLFDFHALVAFARTLAGDAEKLIRQAA
jgi:hypothetical protein